MLERAVQTAAHAASFLAYYAGLVVLIGVVAHVVTWVITRKGTARWVWNYWTVVGAVLMLAGLAGIGYGWLGLGLDTVAGTGAAGLGLLLLSAGLWMVIPI
ncbi:MAG TPA: hypothetical protein VGX21_16645 [Methylomirabilota bacterium]|jgi:hypothetical protein|nr:hypothetical protein [Methylomirabilota bacterium]